MMSTSAELDSGISGRAYITINGENASSERIMFAHGVSDGSQLTKTIIALDIGSISSIDIGHDETGSARRWKLSKVLVHNLSDQSTSFFTIDKVIKGKAISFRGIVFSPHV